ncbi:ferritin-like domain-containing protein [Noviherbaspirillum sp. CPCC 100848]|uniref:Ferritin-like domain-containing protein n=1 Tax=Noviherbaspirillum album TaxID=3080276 RepID=A0ABU6J667_9BURK|nr:ferritin-like domain-containing protein [Noviherbaspirillum sp. CPCC 100848]MEC4719147.1 ferritin-like domain-containing protein [Noviherbaspirillum sp. CPCC 100848]
MKQPSEKSRRRASGAAATAARQPPELLLDKLGERLAFERNGVQFYDALIAKFETSQDSSTSMTLADLQKIRQDEARHADMLAAAIAGIGGDPEARTPSAALVGVEAQGLKQVLADPASTIAQSLHALLVAEMTDNAGWELLIALAEDQEQMALISDFSVALDEERAHLMQVQNWYEEATIGKAVSDGALIDDVSDMNPSSSLH